MENKFVTLSQGAVSYLDNETNDTAIVFIHGLGAAKEVFAHQYESPLAQSYRLIGIDLPGHGDSDKPHDPEKAYSVQGLAVTLNELLNSLSVDRSIVVGWSLGGHVAIEMMQMFPERLMGVMTTGTPPLDHGTFAAFRGYQMRMDLLTALKNSMNAREADRLARTCYGSHFSDAHLAWMMRTDMRLRPVFNRSVAQGTGPSQKTIVETSAVPLCIANGADDPIIRSGFFDTIDYANLWDHHAHILSDAGHAAFLAAPNRFNALLHRYATEMGMHEANRVAMEQMRRSA